MFLIFHLAALILIAYLFTRIGKKIKISNVVALLVCGLVMDIPLFKRLLIEPHIDFLFMLGDVGLIFLMFLAGLESSWRELYNERKDAMVIAGLGIFVPLVSGFIIFRLLGFDTLPSFIVGVCMGITAEATRAQVLMELKKLKTKVGAAMMGAGILDDIVGLSLFVLITYLMKEAHVKEDLLIGGAILAFFLGVMAQQSLGRKHKVIDNTERFLGLLIIPFFFISVGTHFDMNALIIDPLLLSTVIIVAFAGKFCASFLSKPFTKFRWGQLMLIGWSMNSRGAVEMALALIAFRSRIIPVDLYSSLIIMALVTTTVFPFVITHQIKREPKIMG